MIKKTEIMLHCGGSNWGQGNVASIGAYHVEKAGMDMFAYHYALLNGWISHDCYDDYFDGHIESGRADNTRGAHAGQANVDADGDYRLGFLIVCESAKHMTPLQHKGLRLFLSHLQARFGSILITQHSDYNPHKSYCAGFTSAEMQRFNQYSGG